MEQIVAVGEARWFVRAEGNAHAPPLLLLHGFTGCAEFWDGIVERLSERFRCVTLDIAGHGRTAVPLQVERFRLEAVADAVANVLVQLDLPRAHVWGYSMGGRLTLQFALRYPELCNRLVLESASPGLADPGERAQRRAEDEALAERIEKIGVDAFVAEWAERPIFAGQRALPESVRWRGDELRRRNTAAGLAMSLRGMGTGAQEPLHAKLPTLRMPTLILAGEQDAKFRRIGRTMAAQIPNAKVRIVPAAGHSPFWEAPDAAVRIVVPFLSGDAPAVLCAEEG